MHSLSADKETAKTEHPIFFMEPAFAVELHPEKKAAPAETALYNAAPADGFAQNITVWD